MLNNSSLPRRSYLRASPNSPFWDSPLNLAPIWLIHQIWRILHPFYILHLQESSKFGFSKRSHRQSFDLPLKPARNIKFCTHILGSTKFDQVWMALKFLDFSKFVRVSNSPNPNLNCLESTLCESFWRMENFNSPNLVKKSIQPQSQISPSWGAHSIWRQFDFFTKFGEFSNHSPSILSMDGFEMFGFYKILHL